MTRKYDLLIVEDTPSEMNNAIAAAQKRGFQNIKGVNNLSSAIEEYRNSSLVLTDMFFPAGNIETKEYIETFLPSYEDSKFEAQKRLNQARKSPFYLVARQVFHRNSIEEVIPHLEGMGFSRDIKEGLIELVKNHKELESKYALSDQIANEVSKGITLPLGLAVGRLAKLANIPIVIVTSANHHDAYLQPIMQTIRSLSLDYVDSYNNGKDWELGLDKLIK